jgi:hypothetical protein
MVVDYKKIYLSIIEQNFSDMLNNSEVMYKLNNLKTSIDILEFNKYLYELNNQKTDLDFRLKSYMEEDILKILRYQIKHKMSNSEISQKYRISRTTIITWRRRYKNIINK